MATLNKPYCTLAQLQEYLGNDQSSEDEWFQECINRASRIMELWCHTDFWYHDYSVTPLTIQRRWVVKDKIYLPWPIITLTRVLSEETELTNGSDYRYEVGRKRIVYAGAIWPQDKIEDWITVYGTFGYTITSTTQPPTDVSFPATLTQACVEIAGALSGENRKEVVDLSGIKQSLLDRKIPMSAQRYLNRHRTLFL